MKTATTTTTTTTTTTGLSTTTHSLVDDAREGGVSYVLVAMQLIARDPVHLIPNPYDFGLVARELPARRCAAIDERMMIRRCNLRGFASTPRKTLWRRLHQERKWRKS